MRQKIVIIITTFVFFLLISGLINLQVLHTAKFKELSSKNCIRLIPQIGCRGKIIDRNGDTIVDSILSYDVTVLPQEKNALSRTLSNLSLILNISLQDLIKSFKQGYISSSIPVTVARNIELKKAIALEELKSDTSGVIIQPHPVRSYPYGKLASHIIGYLNEIDHWRLTKLEDYGYKTKDIVGFGGIEEKYDYFLREEDGGTSLEVDRRGRTVRVVGFEPPKNGKNIQLTLDINIQKITEESLADRKGSVVIMDPNNGEIIAMASFPDFDPAVFIKQSNSTINALFDNPDAPLFNRAISGIYPPGSVFKAPVAIAGLETGKINSSTSFNCTGEVFVGKQKFACWNVHDQQDLIEALAHSCNTFFYRTGMLLGAQFIYDYAVKFGLGKSTGIDLPYESAGIAPNPIWKRMNRFKQWFEGDTVNYSIGQGDLLVTPLQIVRMMAVFANKGNLVSPYLVKNVEGKDISSYQRKIIKLSFKDSNIEQVRSGLRGVVSYPKGTGNILAMPDLSVAGKTGTAQATGGLSHAWFAGFFPFDEPKFAICVFLERGGPGHNACVLAKQIIERMKQEGLI